MTLLVSFVSAGYSPVRFTKTFGGKDLDRGTAVSLTRDGGYIAVGFTRSYGAGGEDIYVIKCDAKGRLEWEKTYGGEKNDNGWAIFQTQEGGYMIAGFTESFGNGDFDFLLIKTDKNGKEQWVKTYGGEGKDRCWSAQPTDDGGYVLLGETTSFGAGEEDAYMIKCDARGNLEWEKVYGGPRQDRGFSVCQTSDKGYVFTGITLSFGVGERDVYLVKTDANGKMEWSKTFGGKNLDVGHSVLQTSGGGYTIIGYTNNFGAKNDDPYLIKVDGSGNLEWSKVYTFENLDHTLNGCQTKDNGFILVGFSGYITSEGKVGASDILLIKTDPAGKREWAKTIGGKKGRHFGYNVAVCPDGGYILVGDTSLQGAGQLDLLLQKTDPKGNIPFPHPDHQRKKEISK
jgi:hypothetical protein